MTLQDSSNLDDWFDWFEFEFIKLKKQAKEGDVKMYKYFLDIAKKELTKAFVLVQNEETSNSIGEILNIISCELQEISINSKKSQLPF